MIKEAIILAGGLGTRLRDVIKDVPKPMAPIEGRPFLEYLLSYLHKQNIKKVVFAVGYKKEVIIDFFGNKYKDIKLVYSIEEEPLGTGGAILKALYLIENEHFFVLNGDTFFNIDLSSLENFYYDKQADLVIALKEMNNCERYGVIELDETYRIINFLEKPKKTKGLINSGIYLISKTFLNSFNLPKKFSFEKEFLEKYYSTYKFYGKSFDAFFIDIGISEDYEKAQQELPKFFRDLI